MDKTRHPASSLTPFIEATFNSMTILKLDNKKGFDTHVNSQDEDKLNRWPFAKEIYGIATTGPNDWSVRIGLYGEWGTGKTSVLKFVKKMAEEKKHVVVWFNPWEFTSRDDMWRAFVLSVYSQIELVVGKTSRSKEIQVKKWITRATDVLGKLNSNVKDALAISGIEYIKKYLVFDKQDIGEWQNLLGDHRIIIIVDDLDRTNPDLVPEMLFALKEIMDQPGFSFICAFDPTIVGEVLGKYHPGFGDGLKFLDKIIDYPCWLPVPSAEGLISLAQAKLAIYCPKIPSHNLNSVIPLLPKNPRSIGQFIRLLALLKPQIDRHRPDELNWSIILIANIIKILFPRLAHPLLEDPQFWHEVYKITLMHHEENDEKISNLVKRHIVKAIKTEDVKITSSEKKQLVKILELLAKRLDAWDGVYEETMYYQFRIAEAPAAVTWKEYDEFVEEVSGNATADSINKWIEKHREKVGRTFQDVFHELFVATVHARQSALGRAADELKESEMKYFLRQAKKIMDILEILAFKCGNLREENKRFFSAEDFERVFKSLLYYAGWTKPKIYQLHRNREKTFLLRVVKEWGGSVLPLIKVLKPFPGNYHMEMESKEGKGIYNDLCSEIVPRYAQQILARFHEQGFIDIAMGASEGAQEIKPLLLEVNGPLWKGLEKEAVKILGKASQYPIVQDNAYKLLSWFEYMFRQQRGQPYTLQAEAVMKDNKIGHALWAAATVRRLNPRAVGSILELPTALKNMGVNVPLPKWWERAVEMLTPKNKIDSSSKSKNIPEADN